MMQASFCLCLTQLTQLTVQTNTSQEEAKEGEWDKETSSLN